MKKPKPDAAQQAAFEVIPNEPPKAMERLRGWRRLRSMRTAIQLLIVVAVVSIVGSIVPQRNSSPAKVDQFMSEHRFWGEVFDRVGLFNVFTAWWYLALLGFLLFVTLACLLPRTRAYLRQRSQLRAVPEEGEFPPLSGTESLTTALSADEASSAIRRLLKKRWWHLSRVNGVGQFLAERGGMREGGSLLFHWSFFLLALAAAVTITTKFEGNAVIVEGTTWVEGGRVNFDEYSEGRLAPYFNTHKGFTVALDDFNVTYRDDGSPADFVSRIRVLEGGRELVTDDVRVNKPLSFGGVKIYQTGYGWAPVVRVSEAGRVVYSGPVVMAQSGENGSAEGVVKLPSSSGEQAGLELRLFPDFQLVPFRATNPNDPRAREPGALDIISRSDDPNRPLVVITEYRGDLRLDRPQSVYSLDKTALTEVGQKFATFPSNANEKLGSTAELPGDISVELVDLRRFSVLTVKGDTYGIPLAALAATVAFVSLYPALYAHRRRLWIEIADEGDSGSVIRFGGVAYQRKDLFGPEFENLRALIAEAAGGTKPGTASASEDELTPK